MEACVGLWKNVLSCCMLVGGDDDGGRASACVYYTAFSHNTSVLCKLAD